VHKFSIQAGNRKRSLPSFLILGILLFQCINIPVASALHQTPKDGGATTVLSQTFSFNKPTLTEVHLNGRTFLKVDVADCLFSVQPGDPVLPVYPARFLIPAGSKVVGITVTYETTMPLAVDASDWPVLPDQEYVPLDEEGSIPSFVMNTALYASSDPVHRHAYEDGGVGYCRGFAIDTVNLYPVQYIPKTGKLSYYPTMIVTLTLQNDSAPHAKNALLRHSHVDCAIIHDMVVNPSALSSYNSLTPLDSPDGSSSGGISTLGGGSDENDPLSEGYPGGLCNPTQQYQFVIITSQSLKSTTGYPYNWSSLIAHRHTYSGLDGTIVTVQDINACHDYWNVTSTFNDSQAHIREFCKDAYLDWGTDYIILGGDWRDSDASQQIVPYRLFTDRYETNTYKTMACDMYYSHLDGTWYYTSGSVWGGGQNSGVNDHYAELYVGRITVYNASMISNAVKKIIWYDLNASGDWLRTASFAGGDLEWYSQDGKKYMEEIRLGTDTYRTFTGFEEWNTAHPRYSIDTTERLYAYDAGSESAYQALFSNSIENDNASIINNIDHSDYNSPFGLPSWSYRVNTKPFFGYSQGCLAGRFHSGYAGCEQLMCRYTDRNAFALVLNTGYGYGSSGSTNGPSQYQQAYFWDYFFHNQSQAQQNWQLGKAFAYAEDKMSTTVDTSSHAWCYAWYSTQLFGDPAQVLRIANATIDTLTVDNEDPTNGSSIVPITKSSLSIDITQSQGQTFNYTIQTSLNIGNASGTGVHNGTKTCSVSGLAYSTTYHWYVNATDGNCSVHHLYLFTTQSAPVNNPPTIASPSPSNGSTGVSIHTTSLTVSITDPEGDHFNWSMTTSPNVGSGSGTSASNGTKTCTISGLAYSTVYTWVVRAYDGHHWTNKTYTFTTVSNSAPTITSPSPANGSTGVAISTSTLSIMIQDPEGDHFNWTITSSPNIGGASGTSATNGSKTCSVSGLTYSTLYTWFVRACDNHHWINATYHFTITSAPNTPPVFNSISPANASTGVSISTTTLSLNIQDPEGDHFNWTITTTPNIGTASGTSANNGTKSCSVTGLAYYTLYTWVVHAYDSHHWTNATYHFTTEDASVNNPPILTNPNPDNESTEIPIINTTLEIQMNDPEGDPLNWRITTTPAIGDSNETAVLNGTKTCTISGLTYSTTYEWTVRANDGHSWTNETYNFTTESNPPNNAPTLTSPSPSNGSTGISINLSTLSISIKDSDGDTFDWTITTTPNVGTNSGAASSNGSKTCSIGNLAYATTYTWVVRVTDGTTWTNASYRFKTEDKTSGGPAPSPGGEIVDSSQNITPNHAPSTPILSGPNSVNVQMNATYQCAATDEDGDRLQYRIDWDDGTLSPWTALLAANGSISMNHSWMAEGTYKIHAIVQDEHSVNSSWSSGLEIQVSNVSLIENPLMTEDVVSMNVTVNRTIMLTASELFKMNGTFVSYLWDFGDGTNSTGVNPNHKYTTPGVYTVTLTVTDTAGHTLTKTMVIAVAGSTEGSEKESQGTFPFLGILLGIISILIVAGLILYWKRLR